MPIALLLGSWIGIFLAMPDQDGIVIGAEGIDKSGQGVVRISFAPISSTATVQSNNDSEAASTSLRAPLSALEMAGFSYWGRDKVVVLQMNKGARARLCRAESNQENTKM